MKKMLSLFLAWLMLWTGLAGCCEQGQLSPNAPVTLTMWHVYGEQADSPMNRLIEEFNKTVGAEKGIIINVTMMSNASQIGQKLLDLPFPIHCDSSCIKPIKSSTESLPLVQDALP